MKKKESQSQESSFMSAVSTNLESMMEVPIHIFNNIVMPPDG